MFSLSFKKKSVANSGDRRRLRARMAGIGELSDGQKFALKISAFSLGVLVVVVSLRSLLRLFFFGGSIFQMEVPEVKIDRVQISAGAAVEEEVVKDVLAGEIQCVAGKPFFNPRSGIFADDIKNLQKKLMKNPALASVVITRTPKGVVEVTTSERVPVARISIKNSKYFIDRNCVVFNSKVAWQNPPRYPLVSGFAPDGEFKVGTNISSSRMVVAAIELITYLDSEKSLLPHGMLKEVNVSKDFYLLCNLEGPRTLRLAWPDMGRGTEKSRRWLDAQLKGFVGALTDARGANLREFDLIETNQLYAAPTIRK